VEVDDALGQQGSGASVRGAGEGSGRDKRGGGESAFLGAAAQPHWEQQQVAARSDSIVERPHESAVGRRQRSLLGKRTTCGIGTF